jgi:hypothetical protein
VLAKRRVPGVRSFAVLIACALACSDPPRDPLDPEEIQDVAKDEGDAQGTDRSGTYRMEVQEAPECDCPVLLEMDLCSNAITTLATAGGSVLLSQSDGYLLLSESQGLLSMSGALGSDGAFDIAGVYGFSTVLGDIGLYLRLDGRFTAEDRFTGTLQTRALGEIEGDAVDCRNEVPVTGTRITAP